MVFEREIERQTDGFRLNDDVLPFIERGSRDNSSMLSTTLRLGVLWKVSRDRDERIEGNHSKTEDVEGPGC